MEGAGGCWDAARVAATVTATRWASFRHARTKLDRLGHRQMWVHKLLSSKMYALLF